MKNITSVINKVRNKLIVSSESVALTFYQQRREMHRMQLEQKGGMKFIESGVLFIMSAIFGGAGTVRPSWILGLAGVCLLTSRARYWVSG
jgi:hypothetical protein